MADPEATEQEEARMRAVAVDECGPPDVMRIVDAAAPPVAAGELAIDVHFAGVGFVDTLFRSGARGLTTPFTPASRSPARVGAIGGV